MTAESRLRAAVAQAAGAVGAPAGFEPALDRPRDRAHGDWATNAALALAKPLGKKPRDVAEALLAAMNLAEAGVAKATDVVNAILASFDVQRQRLNLHMTLSEQSLNYQLSKGVKPADAMTLTQSLFTP